MRIRQLGFFALLLLASHVNAQTDIRVDAGKRIARVTEWFNGTNIEDLNNQTNGGLFSQLLHGEAFEENMDVDFLHLKKEDYSKVYVVLDERRMPHLITQSDIYTRVGWNNMSDRYDFNVIDIYNATKFKKPHKLSGWQFDTRFIIYDSLPKSIQQTMLDRLNGREQISRFWSKNVSGQAVYKYELVRDGKAYMGRQTQRMAFESGTGEVGLVNKGLYKHGIRFDSQKDYEGVLRLKCVSPTTIYLSLLDENGKVLSEKAYNLKGTGEYEKVSFSLVSNGSTKNGSFRISLKQPGSVDLGFVFLQPGAWGRVNRWPVRKSFVDALKKESIKAIRYNGSMIDQGPDKNKYRWKKMLGPVDERRVVYRNGFNLYATHSFGIIEMLQATEAVGATAIIGMSWDETAEDIRDFVEYVNGSTSTKWGALRAKDGHPQPYGLKYIQVHNERPLTKGYVECMKKFALTAWSVDPQMSIMTSVNIGNGIRRGSKQYELAKELAGWFISQGKGDKLAWDSHYEGTPRFADWGDRFKNIMGINLQENLAKDFPGFKLNLHPMEENGSRCDWDRGLAHAHNWNTLQRYGDCFKMLGTANTFQPHDLHYMWNQGRIHYTADTLWFQPSAYVDEMIMKTWKPNVVEAVSSRDSVLDVTAKLSDDKKTLSLYVVNLSDDKEEAEIDISNFKGYAKKADVMTIGGCALTEYNTYDHMENVAPVRGEITVGRNRFKHVFPKYSYTVITLTRK